MCRSHRASNIQNAINLGSKDKFVLAKQQEKIWQYSTGQPLHGHTHNTIHVSSE